MGSTTFHRRVLTIDATESSANLPSATLDVDATGIELVVLDESPVTADDRRRSFFVDIRMHDTKDLQLTFKLPENATTATYDYGSGPTGMNNRNTRTPSFFVIETMVDKAVTCVLQWTNAEGTVTITVRPRASTQPSKDLSV